MENQESGKRYIKHEMPCFILRIKNNQMKIPVKRKKQVIHVFNSQMNVIFVRELHVQYMNLKNTSVHCCKKIFLMNNKNFFGKPVPPVNEKPKAD